MRTLAKGIGAKAFASGRGFRASHVTALIALFVVLAAWLGAETYNRGLQERRLRAEVSYQASLLAARLESSIRNNLRLVQGLATVLSQEPDMEPERLRHLVAAFQRTGPQLRHVAIAPDMVITFIHPPQGNEQAIGLDLGHEGGLPHITRHARDTAAPILAGPIELVQGGEALMGRFPVFAESEEGENRFWGIISAAIDTGMLYRDSGLHELQESLDIALIGLPDPSGADKFVLGSADILERDPVMADAQVLSGRWTIVAVPSGGWRSLPENAGMLRLLMLAAILLSVAPAIFAGRLIEQRQANIRELKTRESQLGRLSRRLGLALETSRIGVWEMNLETGDLYWDERMSELYGYAAKSGKRGCRAWIKRLHPQDRERAEEELRTAVQTRERYLSEYRVVLEDGEVRHIRSIGNFYKEPGTPERIVGVNWDVTADVHLTEDLKRVSKITEQRNAELEAAKARMEFNALHDSLTGLANRRHLDETILEHAAAFAEGNEVAGLLHIDLDRFKQINDTLGHLAGDAILVNAARILRSVVREDDLVARVGGDEFAVLVREKAGSADRSLRRLAGLAQRIIDALQRPVVHEGHECRVGASIGIASDAEKATDPLRLMVNADIALNRAKARGKNRYQFFNEALHAQISETKRVADEILASIEQKRFTNHYQPQFDAVTLEIVGVEALARWDHPQKGLLAPQTFMKVAEELNVIAAIDQMVLERALADMKRWREEGIDIPKISVNVSTQRLNDEDLLGRLHRMRIEPGILSFELVESIFFDENDDLMAWNVDRIKELGIDIEIDDFGTGYASIVSLMKLGPKRLKIDRQFIAPITHSAQQRQLVGSIIAIGKSLGIEVLAEGVETMEHAAVLRRLSCHSLQGYAFARPMDADTLAEFTRHRPWKKAS